MDAIHNLAGYILVAVAGGLVGFVLFPVLDKIVTIRWPPVDCLHGATCSLCRAERKQPSER